MAVDIPALTQMVVRAAAQATIVAEDFDGKASAAIVLGEGKTTITIVPGAARNLAVTLRAMAETTTNLLEKVTMLEADNVQLTTLVIQQAEVIRRFEEMTLGDLLMFGLTRKVAGAPRP